MTCGWLAPVDSTLSTLSGIAIDRAKFPTRFEEYKLVSDTLAKVKPGVALDAGSGFNPEIHVLPNILGAQGWFTTAVDANRLSLDMPTHERIERWVIDITHLWRWQGSAYDAWLCISTLEHLAAEDQLRTVEAGFGVLRAGGIAIVTADLLAPKRLNGLLALAGFEVGEEVSATTLLTPPVSYAIGRKP